MTSRVQQWKVLDQRATEHLDAHKCTGQTCRTITDLSTEMRSLYAQMGATERAQC